MAYFYFLLGATDAEMVLIEKILRHFNIHFGYATLKGNRVSSSQAYTADGSSTEIPDGAQVVTVECACEGITPAVKIDHHNPGDTGYGLCPELFAEAASIGQVVELLSHLRYEEVEIVFPMWRLAAAGDHCPAAAYQGKCPGISVEEFREYRLAGAAEFQKKDIEVLRAEVVAGMGILQGLEDVYHQGVKWKNAIGIQVPQLPHVAAMLAMPTCYSMDLPKENEVKVGIIGSDEPAVIEAWMNFYADKLLRLYGDPARGYAGGYLPRPATGASE
jgi:hypothetical protein